jgi:hypothetical protein
VAQKVVYVAGSSKKVCQLTGEIDRQHNGNTPNMTETSCKLVGTDLGFSFEHKERAYFLFGDSIPQDDLDRPEAGDAIAYTTDSVVHPTNGIRLTFLKDDNDGGYLCPNVPTIKHGSFEVPCGGFSGNGKMYVLFTTDAIPRLPGDDEPTHMGRSVLAKSSDDGKTFTLVYDFSIFDDNKVPPCKFINVAPVVVENRRIPGLPLPAGKPRGRGVLFFGSGVYRRSDAYLAYVQMQHAEAPAERRYFAGLDARQNPRWSAKEAGAAPLFVQNQPSPVIGELSVDWNEFLGKWVMLYQGVETRKKGVHFRVADKPWGPWSVNNLIYNPRTEDGLGEFIHQAGTDDGLSDPDAEAVSGGPYGPYIISRYTQGTAGRTTTIYWVMSTWNPYNTVLMKSTLALKPS